MKRGLQVGRRCLQMMHSIGVNIWNMQSAHKTQHQKKTQATWLKNRRSE